MCWPRKGDEHKTVWHLHPSKGGGRPSHHGMCRVGGFRAMRYKDQPDNKRDEVAEQPDRDRAIIAPADADSGVLGEAVRAGNYRTFRTALSGYEEWLRKRVGRWIQ